MIESIADRLQDLAELRGRRISRSVPGVPGSTVSPLAWSRFGRDVFLEGSDPRPQSMDAEIRGLDD